MTANDESGAVDDPVLDELIHRADLDGLVRLVDTRTTARDWTGLRRLRDRARHALGTGRQLWPAATLAEYRLALLAPAEWAAGVLDEGSGRFAIGPLTEVVAQHHTFAELVPYLEPGPRTLYIAHERAIRGEDVDTTGLPPVLDVPARLQQWEPVYQLAEYHDASAEFPAPDLPVRWEHVEGEPGDPLDDVATDDAFRHLVEPWTASSNGHAEVVCVEGDAAAAVAALGPRSLRLGRLDGREALRWLAWAGASGGAHGRRRGTAIGRSNAWWVLGGIGDLHDDWPPAAAAVEELLTDLRWWWWDAGEPATGWRLQLAVEDPVDGVAWAFSAHDAA